MNFRPNVVRGIVHNLRTSDVKVKVTNKEGAEVKGKVDIVNENRINFTATEQVDGANVVVEGTSTRKA